MGARVRPTEVVAQTSGLQNLSQRSFCGIAGRSLAAALSRKFERRRSAIGSAQRVGELTEL